jgi:hypothetical protein
MAKAILDLHGVTPNPKRPKSLVPVLALAPEVRGVKRELCKRLGVRYSELDAMAALAVDDYVKAQTKLRAIDLYFRTEPVIKSDGSVAPALAAYSTFLNTASRLRKELAEVIRIRAREDERYDNALTELARLGAETSRRVIDGQAIDADSDESGPEHDADSASADDDAA